MRTIDRSWLLVSVALLLAWVWPAVADDAPSRALLREKLLEGVGAIASAGVPGPLVVSGESAAVIAVGMSNGAMLPVVAAAEWEKGRVVALGHGGMIGQEALQHEGTRRFIANASRWLRREGSGPIGVYRNDAILALVRDLGCEAETIAALDGAELGRFTMVVTDAHTVRGRDREALQQFVTRGGGLLIGGLGWGWLQLHPKEGIRDHPGNRLLAEAGIAWADGTLEPGPDQAFSIADLSPDVHAGWAMTALESAAAAPDREFGTQSSRTLISAFATLPADAPLVARGAAILAARGDALIPSSARPMRRDEGVSRALVSLDVALEATHAVEDIRAHPSAEFFPGAVPEDAARVRRDIELDPAVAGWQGTGLYAPPGAVLVVRSGEPIEGLSVRIGCHTDQLWHLHRWERVPDIVRTKSLDGPETRLASPFGGPVYLELAPSSHRGRRVAPSDSAKPLIVTIEGAIDAPRFRLGVTSDEEWKESRLTAAPWGELESGKVILTLPSASLRTLDDPAALLAFWNQISDAHATLAGIDLQPNPPHRFVPDVQISVGYMHSGYPIMTHLDAVPDMVELERLRRGAWGLLHELGHNHQEPEWTFDGTTEVTVNLFTLHAIDTLCERPPGDRGHDGVNAPPSLERYRSEGARFDQWKQDPFLALDMYVRLQRAFGWEAFRRVFAEYRAVPRAQRPRSDDERRDQWMVRFSRTVGRNLGPYFEAWGVPTSAEARASIAHLPAWDWESDRQRPPGTSAAPR